MKIKRIIIISAQVFIVIGLLLYGIIRWGMYSFIKTEHERGSRRPEPPNIDSIR